MKTTRDSSKATAGGARPSQPDVPPHPPASGGGDRARPRRRMPSSSAKSAAAAAADAPPQPTAGGQRSRSPVFWGASEDAPLYSGPLGEAAGVVPRGSVLLESSRYRDVFGGWWISTRCADGSLGWICYGGGDAAESDGAVKGTCAVWSRVYDTRATPAAPSGATSAAAGAAAASSSAADGAARAGLTDPSIPDVTPDWSSLVPQLAVGAVADAEARHFLFLDAALFHYYWETVRRAGDHRDWNGEYQRAVEACQMLPQLSPSPTDAVPAAETDAHDRLDALLREFRGAVVEAVIGVSAESVVPVAQRRIPSHPAYPEAVFYANGLLLKRCVDGADGELGGDERVAKLANTLYRNMEILARAAPQYFLYTPLLARCTFAGHAFLCSTIPPYGCENLIFANSAPERKKEMGGETRVQTEDAFVAKNDAAARLESDAHLNAPSAPPLVQDLLRGLATALGLQYGAVPWEWRVYAGRDRRLYLSHTTRLLPPVLPLLSEGSKGGSASPPPTSATSLHSPSPPSPGDGDARLYARLVRSQVRPELFFRWPPQWNVNECFMQDAGEEKKRRTPEDRDGAPRASSSVAAGQWIRGDGITQAAGVLGFYLPLAMPMMQVAVCGDCGNTMEANEMRFVVCAHPSQCCRICIQCYTRTVLQESPEKSVDDALSRTCAAAVHCDGGCRRAGAFIMEPSASVVLHAHSVNLRYLPYVLHRLPQSARAAVQHFLHVELVARAAKYVLQEDLRRTTNAAEARAACETVLSALLQPSGTVSERFWRTRLGPVLQAHFHGIREPFHVSVHALRAVAERVQTLTGVWLTDACLSSLDGLTVPRLATSAGKLESSSVVSASDEQGKPFVEIEAIAPRVWTFPVVSPSASENNTAAAAAAARAAGRDEASGVFRVPTLRGRLESLLLFWIGHAPDGADDRQQPFYLDESMFHGDA